MGLGLGLESMAIAIVRANKNSDSTESKPLEIENSLQSVLNHHFQLFAVLNRKGIDIIIEIPHYLRAVFQYTGDPIGPVFQNLPGVISSVKRLVTMEPDIHIFRSNCFAGFNPGHIVNTKCKIIRLKIRIPLHCTRWDS